MLGIEDPYIALVYLLCLFSSLLCVVYGLVCWNRGGEKPDSEDIQWAAEEKKV